MNSSLSAEEFALRASRLKLLVLDVDGVLTDGTVWIGSDGHEAKAFSIRDGASIAWAQRSGLEVALLSGRPSDATTRRAAELRINTVIQVGPEKRAPFQRLLQERQLDASEIAYMGDDLLDLPVLRLAGVSAAPGDAAPEVRERVHWVSNAAGGRGAVREFVEALLRARHSWDGILTHHLD